MLNIPSLLIFTDWFFPGSKAGGPIRSLINLVGELEDLFDVYIFTSDRDFKDIKPYPGLKLDCWQPFGLRSRVFYASPSFVTIKNIVQVIAEIKPNTIYLNSMWSVYFTFWPLWVTRNNSGIKKVLAPRGMLHKGALKFKKYKKVLFISILKVIKISKIIHFHATDYQEMLDILKYFPGSKTSVISNIPVLPDSNLNLINKNTFNLKLCYISRISVKKNLKYILSLLKENKFNCNIDFNIYGNKEEKEYFLQCNSLVDQLSDNIRVSFYQSINFNQVTTIIHNHHFFILPSFGENFGHSIFESLASGRPVIISDQTPWKNLEAQQAGFELPLHDSGLWAATIQKCVNMDQAEFDQLCQGAHKLAKDFFEQNNFKESYLSLFN